MTERGRSTTEISEAHKKAIGEVVLEWAQLEWTVHIAFGALLGMEMDAGRLVGTHIRRVQTLLEVIESVGQLDTVLLERFAEHKAKICELQRERDWIVHGLWFGREGEEHLVGYRDTKPKLDEPRSLSARKIQEVAERINAWNGSLVSILEDAGVDDDCFTIKHALLGKPRSRGRTKTR